jgi:hypothetical protein
MGQVVAGQVCRGQVVAGQVAAGQVVAGQVVAGQVAITPSNLRVRPRVCMYSSKTTFGLPKLKSLIIAVMLQYYSAIHPKELGLQF